MIPPKFFFLFGNKIFPFPVLSVLFYIRSDVGGNVFTVLVLGLPFLFGYITLGSGTNLLKMWRFCDTWTMSNYYLHHGFIYAAPMGLVLYFAFIPPLQNSWQIGMGNMIRCAGIPGFVGWAHDTIAIREGRMEVYNRSWKQGFTAEVIAAQYAPLYFSLLGACYAGIITLGYRSLVLDENTNNLWWLFPMGLTLMSVAISLPFLSWIREVLTNKSTG